MRLGRTLTSESVGRRATQAMALLVKRANASMQAVCIRLIIYNNKRFARNNERANVIHRVVCSAALVNCYYY